MEDVDTILIFLFNCLPVQVGQSARCMGRLHDVRRLHHLSQDRHPARLNYGLVNTLIESQVSYDTNNVPLDLQGVSTELINPLEELQTPVGNYVVTVALDL